MTTYWDRCVNLALPLLNFNAAKFLVIKDWRLGAILRALQLSILAYVLFDVFHKASYLTTEVPTGFVTVWPDRTDRQQLEWVLQQQHEVLSEGELPYCHARSQQYDYERGDTLYSDFECVSADSGSLFIDGESQVFVTTAIRMKNLMEYERGTDGSCGPGRDCHCVESHDYFPIQPEKTNLTLIHSFRTSSVVEKSGTLPETVVRRSDANGGDIRFAAGKQIRVSLKNLLDAAGIDLDARLDEQANPSELDPTQASRQADGKVRYPYARLSGLTLHVSFNYYTRRVAPSPFSKKTGSGGDDTVCVVEITPQKIWTFAKVDAELPLSVAADVAKDAASTQCSADPAAKRTDFERTGVSLAFSVSGNVGAFSIAALINALVAGSVLLAIAQLITTYFALYAFGLSSDVYRAFMRENVDWRREYARYAVQAFVAGHCFEQFDTDDSRELDRKEIFEVLNRLLGKGERLFEWQLAALTDFIMQQGDIDGEVTPQVDGSKDGNQTPGRVPEISINIAEWIDIFTDDKVSWESLSLLTTHEYPSEDMQQAVLRALERCAPSRPAPRDHGDGPRLPLLMADEQHADDTAPNAETQRLTEPQIEAFPRGQEVETVV